MTEMHDLLESIFSANHYWSDFDERGPEFGGHTLSREAWQARREARAQRNAQEEEIRSYLLGWPAATLEALGIGTDDERRVVHRLFRDARDAIDKIVNRHIGGEYADCYARALEPNEGAHPRSEDDAWPASPAASPSRP